MEPRENNYTAAVVERTDDIAEGHDSATSRVVFASNARILDEGETRAKTRKYKKLTFLLLTLLFAGVIVGGVCSEWTFGQKISSEDDNATLEPSSSVTTAPKPDQTFKPSSSVTTAPTTDPITFLPSLDPAIASVVNYINNVTLTGSQIVYPAPDAASPEELALQWIIDEDSVLHSTSSIALQQRLAERYALATLWFNTDGEKWNLSTEWLITDDACTWYGVHCNQNGRVTELTLPNNGLNGFIPSDLCLLRKLTLIELNRNNLRGTIGDCVGSMTSLAGLSLYENQIEGSIPSSVGNCTSLRSLWLSSNKVNGTLPESMMRLSNLEFVHMAANNLSGTLPTSLSQWSNIRFLYLSLNQFNGTIPNEFGESWTNLQVARFEGNDFTGSVPKGFCNSTMLGLLYADCLSEIECSCCTQCYMH